MHPISHIALTCLALLFAAPETAANEIATKHQRVDPAAQKPFLDDPDDFQFAIFADRNGGYRGKVFGDAVRKVNLLQPEFAICVGDLIKGGTTSTEEMQAMYEDLDRELSQLEMPFFRVPGNHDITFPAMAEDYLKRIGQPYWHFVYKNVLFLCLNTEDPRNVLSEQQIRYFERAVRENRDVRWTFVFMHKPLWSEGGLQGAMWPFRGSNWDKMEALLAGRQYTVFAGHTHHYWSATRNGNKHIVVSTTGAGRQERGAENYGEFDHIVWVTMADWGPKIVNLEISGIIEENLRSEEIARMQNLLQMHGVEGSYDKTSGTLRLRNPGEFPVEFEVQFDANGALAVEPSRLERTLAAETSADVALRIVSSDGSDTTTPILALWTANTTDTLNGNKPHVFRGEVKIKPAR